MDKKDEEKGLNIKNERIMEKIYKEWLEHTIKWTYYIISNLTLNQFTDFLLE